MSAGSGLQSVDFEIFGHVQGVCFRMYTEKEGLRLGLVGWVKNTASGTVVGQVQGPAAMVEEMPRCGRHLGSSSAAETLLRHSRSPDRGSAM
ncbi:acylphosphatase-2-like isoform X3 [Xiphophorus couchianus]|uniref:acylphosphatase-2-like isoform X3 n=1 Tax=Xiphophorus couchianus TaxID=32473 RepID=UPI001016E0CB|nr:acylphosphatase-2-like isoform X3 [Xiphophorus couchianus]